MGGRSQLRSVAFSVLIVLGAVPLAYAADCPTVGRPVCQCGDRVIADYDMSADLLNGSGVATCTTGHGLILTSNITLNCHNYAISGNFSVNGIVDKYALFGQDLDNVNVIACSTSNFWTGVRLEDSRDVKLEDIRANNHGHYGVEITDTDDQPAAKSSQRVMVIGSEINGNGDEGIHMSTDVNVTPPAAPNHAIIGNAVLDNGCEGIYILRINGSSSLNYGVRVYSNSVFGNDNGCASGGSHAGIYVKSSSYNRVRYNSLTHDFMTLTDSSSNNTLNQNMVNFGFVKLTTSSSNNSMNQICVLGDTVTPSDSFQFSSSSNNNTCSSCASYRPSGDNITSSGSSGNSFTKLRWNTYPTAPLISGTGVTYTGSNNALSCLN